MDQINIQDDMYKFSDSFYLYLKKTSYGYIYGHYSLGSDNRFYEEILVQFKGIQKIAFDLGNDQISVNIYFITTDNKIKSTQLAPNHSHYIFENFLEALVFINKVTELCYGESLFTNIEFNKNPNLDLNSFKLENLELALLMSTFSVNSNDNICVSELFTDGNIKYYYDVKIFPFVNKNIFMIYKSEEGFYTECTLVFYDELILLKDNYDRYNDGCYAINLLETKRNEKTNIYRLSKENYNILSDWIEQKININDNNILLNI